MHQRLHLCNHIHAEVIPLGTKFLRGILPTVITHA
jgi:hypothetical protein